MHPGGSSRTVGLDLGHVGRLGTYIVDHDAAKPEALVGVVANAAAECDVAPACSRR